MESGRIVFWQENLSPHQASWISALAALSPPRKIVAVFEEDLPPQRVSFGWNAGAPDYGQTKVLIRPGPEVVDSLIHSIGMKRPLTFFPEQFMSLL